MGGTGFFGLGGWEIVVLLVVFLVFVGPQRLPDVTRQLIQWVRQARRWVDDSRTTVEDEMGIAIEDLKKYDPRQYDPRRIIREALAEDYDEVRSEVRSLGKQVDPRELFASAGSSGSKASGALAAGVAGSAASVTSAAVTDEDPLQSAPAPFDPDAT